MKSSTLFDRHHARLTGKSSALNSSSSSSGEVGLSRGANKILEAQRNSTLYQPNALRCDPLKKPKEEREATLGKGWFDLKVSQRLNFSCFDSLFLTSRTLSLCLSVVINHQYHSQ